MKTKILILLITFTWCNLKAQQNTLTAVLSAIESNNSTLKALRESAGAQKLANKTGIYLSGPEAEFGYLWGSPVGTGNRTDISLKQNFDVATISGLKAKVASDQNKLVDIQYKSERMNILLQVKQLLIELAYYNALDKELQTRQTHAETIALSTKKRLDKGDTNILEYNKSMLYLSTVKAEVENIRVERNSLITRLKGLNGGHDVSFEDTSAVRVELALNFNDWFREAAARNPVLLYAGQDVELNKKNISLNKVASLPSLSAGYMSEKVTGQQYQGISVGISIPLWQNKNKIRQAKAALMAAESRRADSEQQVLNHYQLLYDRVSGLQSRATSLRKSLETVSSTSLLKKALDAGEISLLEYIMEIRMYYDNINMTLMAERDAQLSFAELTASDL